MMADMHADFTDQEWDEAGKRADTAVRDALLVLVEEYSELMKSKSTLLFIPMCLGALTASGEMMRIMMKEDGKEIVEEYALAYVRGAIRGLDHPVNADGTEFTKMFDA